jgi:hypothetical protein
VDDFVAEVRTESAFGGFSDRPPSPTPESRLEKFRPAILKAPPAGLSLKTPSPVKIKIEQKPINRSIFPANCDHNASPPRGEQEQDDDEEEEFDQIDLVSNPLGQFQGLLSMSSSSSSSISSSSPPVDTIVHVVGDQGSKKRPLAKTTNSGRLVRKPRVDDDELMF